MHILPSHRACDACGGSGVLSIQQTGKCPKLLCEEADVVIKDIKEIVGVVEKLFS